MRLRRHGALSAVMSVGIRRHWISNAQHGAGGTGVRQDNAARSASSEPDAQALCRNKTMAATQPRRAGLERASSKTIRTTATSSSFSIDPGVEVELAAFLTSGNASQPA